MPWKETCVMNERMRFIARLLDGESMSRLCEEFGISRKTGYKIWNRYQNTGAYALVDRSRKRRERQIIASETSCPNSWNGPCSG